MNSVQEQREKSISIRELYFLLKRHLLLIIIAGFVGGMFTYCVCSMFVDPVYEADAKMIVNSRREQTGSVTNDQITSAQKLVDMYAIIIRSRSVLEPLIEELDLSMSVEGLSQMITVTSVNDTQVMQIAVRSKDPDLALEIAEQIVSICPAIIVDAVDAGSVTTIEDAHLRSEPVAPNKNLYTVIVVFLVIVVVVIVIVLYALLDNTYKSENVLRNDLDLPVLGVIPDYECCQKRKSESKEGKA